MTVKTTQKTNQLQKMGRQFTILLVVIALVLFILEFFLHRHGATAIESSFMFPAIFGFLAFALIVQVGKWLRPLLMRPEEFYEEGTSDD